MNYDATLIIMAAGIGSRFGKGIKQLEKMSDAGEIIMDYSIYDAISAGFNKVVFVIRKEIEEEFRQVIGDRIAEKITVEYAFQELEDLPEGFTVPEGRRKPWGTGQAVLACRDAVKEPFVIINADDYYGKNAYKMLYEFLQRISKESSTDGILKLAMAGFRLKNTLSENGTVTRGLCMADENGMLKRVVETRGIRTQGGRIICDNENVMDLLTPDSIVSMNMWAGTPELFPVLEQGFREFLSMKEGDPMKKEYLLPDIVAALLSKKQAEVTVLGTDDRWIGITYQEDVAKAKEDFRALEEEGIYHTPLWR